jgi:tetratricopeptide (TPR) repeat protein
VGAWRSELGERRRAEAAEARATARLDDVHGLIAALVGGIHDRLGSLVGAVPVRDYVVETAERYLAALESESESASDPRLGRALAEVHLRLAEVRGARTQGSRGEIAVALGHVQRAMQWIEAEVGERVSQDGPLETAERRLRALRLNADLERASGDLAGAGELYDEVLASAESALAAHPLLPTAQIQPNSVQRQGCLRSIERTRAAALMQRGRTRFARGAGAAALADLDAAGGAFAALLALAEEASLDAHTARRDLALLRAEQGRVLVQLGHAEPAMEAWRAAAELLSELERSAPADGQVVRDRLELEAELATTQAEQGELEVAEATIGLALTAARDLARRDADNLLATRVLRLVLLRGARVALARKETGLTLERYDEAATLARAELAAAPGASSPRDLQAALDLAECEVMGAEVARRTGALEGLAARFEAGLAVLPGSAGALARGDHFVGNLRAVAAVGLGSLLASNGDHQEATRVLEAARAEARAWSESHGSLHWPLRSEASLEYALGSSYEALADQSSDRVRRGQHLAAAHDAYQAGLAAAQRLEREGRAAPHEQAVVGFFKADLARVEAAMAGP